jgi:hypothetical protein
MHKSGVSEMVQENDGPWQFVVSNHAWRPIGDFFTPFMSIWLLYKT